MEKPPPLTPSQLWTLFIIWWFRVVGLVVCGLTLLIAASHLPALLRSGNDTELAEILVMCALFIGAGVAFHVGGTLWLRWYREEIARQQKGFPPTFRDGWFL